MLFKCAPAARWFVSGRVKASFAPQWHPVSNAGHQRYITNSRSLRADNKSSVKSSETIVLPGTSSKTATKREPPPPGAIVTPTSASPVTPSSDTSVPPENIPLVPPTPPAATKQNAPPSSIPPRSTSPPSSDGTTSGSPPPSSPPRRPRRFRRFLLGFILLSSLSYAGGIYYSLVSDNFHDFFTEYVPYGEDAVLYFEEREYRKRFPNITNPTNRPVVDSGNKITIPSKSGVSWKVAEDGKKDASTGPKGSHISAIDAKKPDDKKGNADQAKQTPVQATGPEKTKAVQQAKKDAHVPKPADTKAQDPSQKTESPPATPSPTTAAAPTAESRADTKSTKTDQSLRPPEVNEPSRIMPVEPIDPLTIKNADEPIVQDLVKVINDIITVVNNDGSARIYGSTLDKAKSALAGIGGRIIGLKTSEENAAAEQVRSLQSQFDEGARELVRRLEEELKAQEGRWRDDFDIERQKLVKTHEERLSAEMQRAQEVLDQRVKNELLSQAIALKKEFLSEITDRVENERDGRLSKLSSLSSSVAELEKLTAEWNTVVDANLKTQHLQVAVETVRSALENTNRPRPFVHELAALKEIASHDPVVNAAIASINPTAYQRGIPTSAQLIDRFRRVADEVRKAALLPEEGGAGIASHAASVVLSKLMFKKKGMTVGQDVESVLTRTETLLEEGRLDEAAREMTTLQGWAKTLSWDWLSECRRVLEVRQAMDVIATEARLEALKVEG